MKDLLYVAHRIPYPPNKGEKIRAWHQIEHLARDWRVHLATLVDDPADWQHLDHLRTVCASVGAVRTYRGSQTCRALARCRPGGPLMPGFYWHPQLQAWIDEAASRTRFDLVMLHTVAVAPLAASVPAPKLLDMVDIDSLKWAEYAGRSALPMRAVWAREAATLQRFEREAARRHDRTLFVSEAECRAFAALAPEAADRLDWVSNGVDLERFRPALDLPNPYTTPGPHLTFTGHMDYRPNAEAAIWFARDVLPLLRRTDPTAMFHVVGANPTEAVRALSGLPGVQVTGAVPQVQPYLRHADVSVSPLLMARGIQNKVLEAMAMGLPVVASPQAVEGIAAGAGQHLLVADGAAATAQAVSAVLSGQHPKLGAAARGLVETSYAWSSVLRRLDAMIDLVLSPPQRRAA